MPKYQSNRQKKAKKGKKFEISLDKKTNSKSNVKVIFTYSLKHLAKKDKIRFYYALKGRDGKSGLLKTTKTEQLGRAVLLVSLKFDQEFQEFFKLWDCPFERKIVKFEIPNKTIFIYSLKHLVKKDKIRFYYALKGRDGDSGVFKSTKAEQLGRTVLLASLKFEQELQKFFKLWNCKFRRIEVAIKK